MLTFCRLGLCMSDERERLENSVQVRHAQSMPSEHLELQMDQSKFKSRMRRILLLGSVFEISINCLSRIVCESKPKLLISLVNVFVGSLHDDACRGKL